MVSYLRKRELRMLDLFVRDAVSDEKVPAVVNAATEQDLASTKDWQTSWETTFARGLPKRWHCGGRIMVSCLA